MSHSFKFMLNSLKISQPIVRGYAFKSDLKIKWIRPATLECYDPKKTGDCAPLPKVDGNEFIWDFRNSTELKTADENVKKLFQIKNNPRHENMKIISQDLTKSVQRHELDFGSMESKLAFMTSNIRSMQEVMKEFPRNKILKVKLKEMIDKRKKFLKFLRRWDYKRFEWLLEKLDLVYKAHPERYTWVTRKDSLRKLTDTHCNNIRDERLKAYRAILESQKVQFLDNKLKNLLYIQESQREFKLPVTISNEEIDMVKNQLKSLRIVEQTDDGN